MNKQQIQWASEHDWFLKGKENSVLVASKEFTSNGTKETHIREFTNFNSLRDWAGY